MFTSSPSASEISRASHSLCQGQLSPSSHEEVGKLPGDIHHEEICKVQLFSPIMLTILQDTWVSQNKKQKKKP